MTRTSLLTAAASYAATALIVLPGIGGAQEPPVPLCNAVQTALDSEPDLIGTPEELTFEGQDSACLISSKGAIWSCRLGSLTACRARESTERTGADPAPLLALYESASQALRTCLSHRTPKAYEYPEAIIDRYVQFVRGTEFAPSPSDPSQRSANATITGRLNYEPDRLCEMLAVDISVR